MWHEQVRIPKHKKESAKLENNLQTEENRWIGYYGSRHVQSSTLHEIVTGYGNEWSLNNVYNIRDYEWLGKILP